VRQKIQCDREKKVEAGSDRRADRRGGPAGGEISLRSGQNGPIRLPLGERPLQVKGEPADSDGASFSSLISSGGRQTRTNGTSLKISANKATDSGVHKHTEIHEETTFFLFKSRPLSLLL